MFPASCSLEPQYEVTAFASLITMKWYLYWALWAAGPKGWALQEVHSMGLRGYRASQLQGD